MALDLMLAAQGGVCKFVQTECCVYISDSSSAVHDVIADTERGIKELHEEHGWNPFGGVQALFGSWGASLFRGLLWLLGGLLLVIIVFMSITAVFRMCVRSVTSTPVLTKYTAELLEVSSLPDPDGKPPPPDDADAIYDTVLE